MVRAVAQSSTLRTDMSCTKVMVHNTFLRLDHIPSAYKTGKCFTALSQILELMLKDTGIAFQGKHLLGETTIHTNLPIPVAWAQFRVLILIPAVIYLFPHFHPQEAIDHTVPLKRHPGCARQPVAIRRHLKEREKNCPMHL